MATLLVPADLFPIIPWIGTLNDWGAAVSTANATWWLVVVGIFSCLVTFFAALSAFLSQRLQLENDAWRESIEAIERDRDILVVVVDAIAFAAEAQADIAKALDMLLAEVWDLLAYANIWLEALKFYLDRPVGSPDLVYVLLETRQRIYEIRAGLEMIRQAINTGEDPEQLRARAQGTIREANFRLARLQTPIAAIRVQLEKFPPSPTLGGAFFRMFTGAPAPRRATPRLRNRPGRPVAPP